MLLLTSLIAIPNMVAPSTAPRNACIANLRQIESAKEQWALEHKKRPGDAVESRALLRYFKNGQAPLCPRGGRYSFNAVGTEPTCSLGDAFDHTIKLERSPPGR